LIFVSEGSPARQVRLPRNWPWILVAMTVFCLGMSLLAGRKVRAWVDEGADRIARTDITAMALAGYSLRTPYRQTRPTAWPLRATPFFSVWSNTQLGLPRSLRKLRLFDVNAKRSLAVLPFARDGVADANAFMALREFLRCRRTGHTIEMNPRLIQLLLRISQHFKAAELQIISAHRAADGVVTNETSQHNYGTAADIRVSGISVETLTEVAKELGAGGVGTYFRNHFVHVDVREKRYFWREETGAPKELSPADSANAEAASDAPVAAALEVAVELPAPGPAELSAAAAEAAAELPVADPAELAPAAPVAPEAPFELPAEPAGAPAELPAAPGA
jgi:uncharacterized protein YcbK (DUF882 family)